MKRKIVLFVVLALIAAGTGVWLWSAKTEGDGKVLQKETSQIDKKADIPVRANHARPRATGRTEDVPSDNEAEEDDDEMPGATAIERMLMAEIRKAQDDENLQALRDLQPRALACPRKDVRAAMVEALGWFDEKALAELTPFLLDADDEVRESAQSAWSTAVSAIENEPEKIAAVEMVMATLSDADFLEEVSNEYIGADEKRAVESLMRVIAAGGTPAGIAKAKETYEFVTGDEWKDEVEAQRWIAEEYVPPED